MNNTDTGDPPPNYTGDPYTDPTGPNLTPCPLDKSFYSNPTIEDRLAKIEQELKELKKLLEDKLK